MHCHWGAWSVAGGSAGRCDKACGGGVRTLTRTVARQAQHGGNKCPGPTTKTERCNSQPCAGKESDIVMLIDLVVKHFDLHIITKLSIVYSVLDQHIITALYKKNC